MINRAISNLINNQKKDLPIEAFSQSALYCYTAQVENTNISQENLGDLLNKGTLSAFYTIGLIPDLNSGYALEQTDDAILYGTIKSRGSATEQDGAVMVENPILRFALADKISIISKTNITDDKMVRFFRFKKPPTTKVDIETGSIVDLSDSEIIEYEKTQQKTYYLFDKKVVLKPATTINPRESAYYVYTLKEFSRQIKKNWFIFLSSLKQTQVIGGLPEEDVTQEILNNNKGTAKVRISFTKPALLNNFEIIGSQNRKAKENFARIAAHAIRFNNQLISNDQETTDTPLRVIKLNPVDISNGNDLQWQCQQAVEYNYFYQTAANMESAISTTDQWASVGNASMSLKARITNLVNTPANETLRNGSGIFNGFESPPTTATTYNSKNALLTKTSELLHHSFNASYQGGKWNNGAGLFQKAYKQTQNQQALNIQNSIFDFNIAQNAQISAMSNPNEFDCNTDLGTYKDITEDQDILGKIVYDSTLKTLTNNNYYCEFPLLPLSTQSSFPPNHGVTYIQASYETNELYNKNKSMFALDWLTYYKTKRSKLVSTQFKEQIATMLQGAIFNQYFASNELIHDFINGDFRYNNQPLQTFGKTQLEAGIANTIGNTYEDKFAKIDTITKPSSYYCLMEIEETNIPWIKNGKASFGDRPSVDSFNLFGAATSSPIELVSVDRTHKTLIHSATEQDGYYLKGTNTKLFTQEDLDNGVPVALELSHDTDRTFIYNGANAHSIETLIQFPNFRPDPTDTSDVLSSSYVELYHTDNFNGQRSSTTNHELTVQRIQINGTWYNINVSSLNYSRDRFESFDKDVYFENGLYQKDQYYYQYYQFPLENIVENREFGSPPEEVNALINKGLWGMNYALGLGSGLSAGSIDRIGVLDENYFDREKPQVYELELEENSTTYGSLTSQNDGYGISEITIGAFTRGDFTIECIDTDGNVIKTQKIAGQKAGSENAKILSHTIKG